MAEASDAEDESEDEEEEEAAGEADLAAYRLRGPAVRRAHKREAMSLLREWLATRAAVLAAPNLAAVEERYRNDLVGGGLNAWQLIDDVLTHQSREAIWTAHGVWLARTPTDELVCSAARPDAPPWPWRAPSGRARAAADGVAEEAGEAPEDAPARPAGFEAAQAELLRWLSGHALEGIVPHLHRVLGVWRKEQLIEVREGDLQRLHLALPPPRLPYDARRALLSAAAQLVPHGVCSVCGENKALAISLPCGCAVACAACTTAAGAQYACVGCQAPCTVVAPPEFDCPFCANCFTPAELYTFEPCGHQLCVLPCAASSVRMLTRLRSLRRDVACAVGCIRRALDDRSLLPLKCEQCRADAPGTDVPPLAAASLRPLLLLSRSLIYTPECPPLSRAELQAFEEHHAAAAGLAARCPREGCGRMTLLDAGAAEPRVDCSSCHEPFCRICATPWHAGVTCEEHAEQLHPTDNATAAFLRRHVAKCPTEGCTAMLGVHERGHRCHHVGCAGCGAQYCYVCLATRQHGCNCSLYCDDNCRCPDCVVCRPGHPCDLCSEDGRCRSCHPVGGRGRRG